MKVKNKNFLKGEDFKELQKCAAFSLSCQIPLKHSPQARARLEGGDLTLNSLLRTWLSFKHPLSSRAFKQLECMAKV